MRSVVTSQNRVRRTAAFTLVELLVVIGIIAVLVSILMPALSAARASAVRVTCMARLREVGHGFQLYSLANKNIVGFQIVYADRLGVGRSYTWYGNSKYVRSTLSDFSDKESLLTPFLGARSSLQIADCPAMMALAIQPDSQDLGFSPAFGGAYGITTADSKGNSYIKYTQITEPTETVLMADTGSLIHSGLSRWNWMMEPRYANGSTFSIPRFHGRHRGKGNVLWFDGHVTSETPELPPEDDGGLIGGGVGAATFPFAQYKKANIGYLKRRQDAWSDSNANYYFFINKAARTLTIPR